jgi:hypothetical protein
MTKDEALKEALANYMAAFGQALEAHGIPYGQQQIDADKQAREALEQPDPVLAEREACAQLCDKAAKDWELNAWDDDADEKYGHKESACEECADAIRARSQS